MSFLNSDFKLLGTDRRIGDESLLQGEDIVFTNRPTNFKDLIEHISSNHFRAFLLVFDVFCVILLTLVLLSAGALRCDQQIEEDEVLEWCQPFQVVDSIVVELSYKMNYVYDPRACVAHAQTMMESRGFNYNFIMCGNDVVYVGNGYQCRSDSLRVQMKVNREIQMERNNLSFYLLKGDFNRYSEIIQEGLDCGFIRPNFTVTVTCPIYGEWCGAQNIRDLPWARPERLARNRTHGESWWPPAQGSPTDHPFAVFDVHRVYHPEHRLKACNASRS